jgi:hypothetical protein
MEEVLEILAAEGHPPSARPGLERAEDAAQVGRQVIVLGLGPPEKVLDGGEVKLPFQVDRSCLGARRQDLTARQLKVLGQRADDIGVVLHPLDGDLRLQRGASTIGLGEDRAKERTFRRVGHERLGLDGSSPWWSIGHKSGQKWAKVRNKNQ